MGTVYFGPGPTIKLISTARECIEDWGDDTAYKPAAQKLREVIRELDVLTQSPGTRQAARLSASNQTGHEPPGDADEASEAY